MDAMSDAFHQKAISIESIIGDSQRVTLLMEVGLLHDFFWDFFPKYYFCVGAESQIGGWEGGARSRSRREKRPDRKGCGGGTRWE